MQYKINATIIKHWYQYGCERKLLYSADKIESKTQIETVPDNYPDSSQHPGTIFEEEVVEILSQSNHVYKPKPNKPKSNQPKPTTPNQTSPNQTIQAQTKPTETKPVQTKPAQPKPA